MIIDYIVDFTQYLNDRDFNISNDKISWFFKMLAEEEIDFTNEDDLLELMKIVFCSNKGHVEVLPSYFRDYFNKRDQIISISKMEKQQKESKTKLIESTNSRRQEILDIKKEIEAVALNIKQENTTLEKLLTKEEEKFVMSNISAIEKIKLKNKKGMSFIKDCIINNDTNAFNEYSSNFLNDLANEFVKLSEKALSKSDIEKFGIYQKIFNIIKRLAKTCAKQNKAIEEKVKAATTHLEKKISNIEDEIAKEEKKHREIQKQLDNMISKINDDMKIVKKEAPLTHRDVFIGKNAVQIIGDVVPECIETDFKKLQTEDLHTIYYYIKKNLLKFKTRMTRNINTKEKRKIDIKETIQNACKTGGLPINICYEKPKINKTKLILVLDVSGSCKEASEMMLTFMYSLQSVFPGGCKTFAFVDSLYNISDIMKASDINDSIKDVLDTIPRKGVYSNYFKPLRSLWVDNRNEITSDSIVIFMGDARNNANDPGIEYVKNIARKAKKAYWLNTEEFSKWGVKDSLAFEYSKFFKMYEVLNASDLIGFINLI